MITLYEVAGPGPGRLATMARPPGGADLPAAMAQLAQSGVHTLVSALEDSEAALLGLSEAPVHAQAVGLSLLRFPIPDVTAPPPEALPAVLALADRLADEIRSGRYVVTHCRAGIGRCSMLAGATLVRLGTPPDQAWELIRAARGWPVPDNAAQERWLYTVAQAS
ncbi:MAG TPA: tyrosine protein phosphatase [Natronosporangium sp.]|nr:tyrosine protein phosphatase [Natronosporangium sp.]